MKFLVAIVLLVSAVAEAQDVPEHTLSKPRFKVGYTYTYDAVLNVTAGVLGLSPQVSASVLRADVKIYAKTKTEHILKIENVRISGSVPAIDNKWGDIDLHSDDKLDDRLSSPIRFWMQKGMVTKYTLSRKDNLESKKIKKSILRSLEMYVPEDVLGEMKKNPDKPVMYNTTENSDYGIHTSNYIITASPNMEYPAEAAVYNISRVDNHDGEWYSGHKLHHNFQKQGCPEVCRQNGQWVDNQNAAGCPSGFEPHHSPIKRSFSHKQSLSPVMNLLTPEIISTVEAHFAKMYDQDMEVLIRYRMQRRKVTSEEKLNVEDRQDIYEDLHKKELEINDDEIDQLCDYKRAEEAVQSVKQLLKDVSELIVDAEPGSPVGEKIILLREAMALFTLANFEEVARNLPRVKEMEFKNDTMNVQRQVWLEVLPLVGTQESVKFIVKYIRDEIKDGGMIVWEAKEMLESLPRNIERPAEDTVKEIKKLLKDKTLLRKSSLLHSAVHLTMGRVIGDVCGMVPVLKTDKEIPEWQRAFQRQSRDYRGLPRCPEEMVMKIIEDISKDLEETRKPEEMAVFIETLCRTGMEKALWKVVDYAHGTAKNMNHFSPRHMSFMKSAFVRSLHHIAARHPAEVMEIVLPIFFNDTETSNVRNAAFGVMMMCQPSLGILERVATHSWFEKSREVGSFVTSTLETYGNSTLPCMQLLSHRVKEILPQIKKFNLGMNHAKNKMWTYYDALRQFGLEGRLEYTPNNESFVPRTFYNTLTYTMGSLKDLIFQNSLSIEGLTEQMITETVMKFMDKRNIVPISREREVFGEGKEGLYYMNPRTVEDLRLVSLYELFYKSSYYYLDMNGINAVTKEFAEIFEKYLRKSRTKYNGYLVKLFLPSSYHTVAVAKALPYPLEFKMYQPLVLSLGVKTDESMETPPTRNHFHFHFRPSIHASKLYTYHMKNIGDCKEVGVFHTHKIAMTYPFEIKFNGNKFPDAIFRYKIPEMPKKVLYYYAESGTYAGRKDLEALPFEAGWVPIRTLPSPFKFTQIYNPVGLPPFKIEAFTEDLNLFHQKLPRTLTEFLHLETINVMNAGWRYKSANITLLEDRTLWTGENEVTFRVQYTREHVKRDTDLKEALLYNQKGKQQLTEIYSDLQSQMQPIQPGDDELNDDDWSKRDFPVDIDWSKYMIPGEYENILDFAKKGQAVSNILIYLLPHIKHTWNISVNAEPLSSSAYILMQYNHTYDKDLQLFHVAVVSSRAKDPRPYEVNIDHAIAYYDKPDELNYGSGKYGMQWAYFRTAVNWPKPGSRPCRPFEKMELAICGHMLYESNKDLLERQLWERVQNKYFLPEKHEECLRDVRDGNPLSPNCVKAIREYSAFNRMSLNIQWNEELPHRIKHFSRVADEYLQHIFFEHTHLNLEENAPRRIDIRMEYLDKLVDEPVANWIIKKPSETVTLRQIRTNAQPFSSVYPMQEALQLQVANNSYPATCVLSENYVQTYDLVSYPFKPEDCFYVLSSHCTKTKNFAILLKGSKEIHIHVANTKIVLTPPTEQKSYKVLHDGKVVTIEELAVFDKSQDIYGFLERSYKEYSHSHLRIVANSAGVNILYDGKTVKIQVSARYKGELCGLCSEFDGEAVREFMGMDRCLYTDHIDFANSNLVRRSGNCDVLYPRAERICEDPRFNNWTPKNADIPQSRDVSGLPRTQRNIVIYKGDEVCFSVRPVSVCQEDEEPTATKDQRIGFHCLPKDDQTARNLINEAKWRPLDELRRKSVDHVQTVKVPNVC